MHRRLFSHRGTMTSQKFLDFFYSFKIWDLPKLASAGNHENGKIPPSAFGNPTFSHPYQYYPTAVTQPVGTSAGALVEDRRLSEQGIDERRQHRAFRKDCERSVHDSHDHQRQ
jgi:hypothetical protein